MSNRRRYKPRCNGCGLTPATCVCAELPTISLSTPLVIVQHVGERFKPTNTGRLLATMIPNTQIVPYGMREPEFDPGPLSDASIAWQLLFPREGAPELGGDAVATAPEAERQRGYVLLDGTWHQCSRMSRRVPIVRDLPCVALSPGTGSIWAVRTQHDPRGLSTFEAGLRVLESVHGSDVIAPAYEAFARITAQLLFLKGKLPSPDVPVQWVR